MKTSRLLLALPALCSAMVAGGPAYAHGGRHWHSGVGIYIGGPVWPWPYAFRPYYYYPPVVAAPVVAPPPTVYIEQPPQAPSAQGNWYYCNSAKAYYPYVSQCPEGWQLVQPQPSR